MTKRLSTLIKLCGDPVGGDFFNDKPDEWKKACDENRVITVMDAGYALVGVRAVDTRCKLVFPNPLPKGLTKVIGVGPIF